MNTLELICQVRGCTGGSLDESITWFLNRANTNQWVQFAMLVQKHRSEITDIDRALALVKGERP